MSGVPDSPHEITISIPKMIICGHDTISSGASLIISKTKAINSQRVLVIDGPYTITSVPDSIIHTQEAVISAVETIISAAEMDFFKADAINPVVDTTIPAVHTIISAFPTSFFAAVMIRKWVPLLPIARVAHRDERASAPEEHGSGYCTRILR